MLLWFIMRLKRDHFTIIKKCLATGNHWRIDALANQVVSQLNVGADFLLIKQIKKVFAVGCRQRRHVHHLRQSMVETFELASLQVISARKNDALVVGQHHASRFDFVHTNRGVQLRVEHQKTKCGFLIRTNL